MPMHMPQQLRVFSLAAATIMRVAYGFDIKDSSNKYIQIAEESMIGIAEGAVPGRWLVDQLPICKCLRARSLELL